MSLHQKAFSHGNMKQQKSFVIWEVVKHYYWLQRTFGLAAFSIKGNITDGRITTGPLEVLHFLIIVSLQLYVLYLNIIFDLSLSRTNSFLIDKGAHAIEIFNGFNVAMGTCLYAIYRKRIWKVLRKCHEFDEEVRLK